MFKCDFIDKLGKKCKMKYTTKPYFSDSAKSALLEEFGDKEIALILIEKIENKETITNTIETGLGITPYGSAPTIFIINIILDEILPSGYEYWAGDMNEDGILDILDIILIINTL